MKDITSFLLSQYLPFKEEYQQQLMKKSINEIWAIALEIQCRVCILSRYASRQGVCVCVCALKLFMFLSTLRDGVVYIIHLHNI